MNADCKGALAQLNQSYKSFVHNGSKLSKKAVKEILEYAISKGYAHTGLISDAEIDHILTKGTTIQQWEMYYADLKAHEELYEREKPKREYFNTDEEFKSSYSQWEMNRSMFRPNKPGYYRANND